MLEKIKRIIEYCQTIDVGLPVPAPYRCRLKPEMRRCSAISGGARHAGRRPRKIFIGYRRPRHARGLSPPGRYGIYRDRGAARSRYVRRMERIFSGHHAEIKKLSPFCSTLSYYKHTLIAQTGANPFIDTTRRKFNTSMNWNSKYTYIMLYRA